MVVPSSVTSTMKIMILPLIKSRLFFIIQISADQSSIAEAFRTIQNPEIKCLIIQFHCIMFQHISTLDLESFKILSKDKLDDPSNITYVLRMSQNSTIEGQFVQI